MRNAEVVQTPDLVSAMIHFPSMINVQTVGAFVHEKGRHPYVMYVCRKCM